MFRTPADAMDASPIVPRETPAPHHIIGNVSRAVGAITALRAGVSSELKAGDVVCRGDVIETGADGAIGLAFSDGTLFSLSSSARLELNEFVCDCTGGLNLALLSLAR